MSVSRFEGRLRLEEDEGLKPVLENIRRVKELLDYISLKLEVFVATGVVLNETLGKAAEASRLLKEMAAGLPPHTASLIMEVDESLRGLLQLSGLPPERGLEALSSPALSEEAGRILEEAERVAKLRSRETIP